MRVVIIGGGLSGLCLANGLLNEKIDVVVYEREQMDARKDGYQIRMATAGYEGLRRCLDPELFAKLRSRLGAASHDAPFVLDPTDRHRILDLSTIKLYPISKPIARTVLRGTLFEKPLDAGIVVFGKQYDRYEIVRENGHERVKVLFNDGSSDICDILVGADGVRSKVNQQLGLNNRYNPPGWNMIMSRGPVKKDLSEVSAEDTITLWMDSKMCGATAIYYPESLKDVDTRGMTNATSYEESGAHLFINNAFKPDLIPPAEAAKMDGQAIKERVMKELSDSKRWHPYLRELWSVAEPDTIKVGSASSSKRPALTWRRDLRAKSTSGVEGHPRVWLLGDSMHAMLPSRGQGGNAALADAASALDEIVKLGKDGEPSDARVEAACTAFENEMIPRSFAWVKASENADIYLDKWGGYLAAKTFVGVLRVLGYATDVLEKFGFGPYRVDPFAK